MASNLTPPSPRDPAVYDPYPPLPAVCPECAQQVVTLYWPECSVSPCGHVLTEEQARGIAEVFNSYRKWQELHPGRF